MLNQNVRTGRVRLTLPFIRTQEFFFNILTERFLDDDTVHEFAPDVDGVGDLN